MKLISQCFTENTTKHTINTNITNITNITHIQELYNAGAER